MDENLSEENIKHLIFREEPEEVKFPIYQSRYSQQVREEKRRVQDCHRTMGFPSDYPTRGPSDYLKKGARVMLKHEVEKPKYNLPPKDKVPRRCDWTKPPAQVTQNFIYSNALNAIRAGPKRGSRRVWDSSAGYEVHCCVSEPKFVLHKGYAKVPKYIKEFKRKHEQTLKEKEEMESMKKTGPQPISAEERDQIIKGLKKLWEEKQKEFELLPMITDTVPQVKRKSRLEKELNDLEKEIDTIERNKIIYVDDDPETFCQCNK